MNIQVIKEWSEKGFRYVRITAEGAVNKPILKFPLEQTINDQIMREAIERKLDRQVAIEQKCPVYPNWMLKADGSCGRDWNCTFHAMRCPAK